MNVRFEFKLFLPFLLPRNAEDWGASPICFQLGEVSAGVLVLPRTEVANVPLGPDGLTITSSNPGSSPDETKSQVTTTPHKYFYDVIVVAVFGTLKESRDVVQPTVRAKFLNAAIEGARRFLMLATHLFTSPDTRFPLNI